MKWFKHDAMASQDSKLKKLRMKYGLEGYGLYWYCLELIAKEVDVNNINFELDHDSEILSFELNIHEERIKEMMTYMVKLELFENSNGTITCLKLAKRLDTSMTSNPTMRKLIDKIRKNHDLVMTESEKVMQDKIRLDKSRVDNIKHLSASQAKANENDSRVTEIFRHWQKVMGKDSRAKLTQKRKSKISARLKDGFTVQEICRAISGCANSAYHMGQNDSGTIYDDLELICRDDGKLRQFLSISEKPKQQYSQATATTIQTLNEMEFD